MRRRLTTLVASARSSKNKSFLREFLSFGSSTVLVQFSRVGSGLVVAGIVGPIAWGDWYLLNLIIAYGALSQLGVLNGMNRDVPAALGRNEPELAVRLRQAALGLLVLASVSVVLLLLGLSLSTGIIHVSAAFLLTLVLLLASQVQTYVSASLRSTTQFKQLSVLQLIQAVAYPVFSITGAVFFGLPGFIVGQILTLAITSLAAIPIPEVKWSPILDRALFKQLVFVGFPIMLVGVVHTIFTTVDRWVVAGYLGAESLGHYSLAIMALGAVGLLPQVISQQFYPRMARTWAAEANPAALRSLATKQRWYTLAVVLPVVAVLAVLAPVVVRAFLPAYTPGISALVVTMLVPLVTVVGAGYSAVLHVLNWQLWYLFAIIFAAVFNLGASLLLVRPFGLVGVAMGTMLAFLVLSLLRLLLGTIALRRAEA